MVERAEGGVSADEVDGGGGGGRGFWGCMEGVGGL